MYSYLFILAYTTINWFVVNIYTVVGALAYMFFYLRNRYMGSNRQGEGGAVGKYTGKIKHSKIKILQRF